MARRRAPSYDDAVSARDDAHEFGIDLALLDANLRLTPRESLAQLACALRWIERVQADTLTPAERERLERRAMLEELTAYGFTEDLARYEAMGMAAASDGSQRSAQPAEDE